MTQTIYSIFVFVIAAMGAPESLAADFCADMQAPIDITGFAKARHLPRNDSFRRVRGFARETYPNFTKLCESNLDEELSQKATRFIEQAEAGNIDCSYLGKDLSAKRTRTRGPAMSPKIEFKKQLEFLSSEKERILRLMEDEQKFSHRRGPASENGEAIYLGESGIFQKNLGGLSRWIQSRQEQIAKIDEIERRPAAAITCNPPPRTSKWNTNAQAFAGINGTTTTTTSSASTGGGKK